VLYATYYLRAQYKAGLKALERVKESVEFDHEGRKHASFIVSRLSFIVDGPGGLIRNEERVTKNEQRG